LTDEQIIKNVVTAVRNSLAGGSEPVAEPVTEAKNLGGRPSVLGPNPQRMMVIFPEQMLDRLRIYNIRSKISVSQLIREAVEEWLKVNDPD
jgi:hypothetical protein